MSRMRFKSNRSGFLKGKGFYVALALCLLAVGAASYIAVLSITDMPDDLNLPGGTDTSSASSFKQVGQTVSGATGSRPSSAAPSSAAPSSAAPKPSSKPKPAPTAGFFVMPITGEIIRPYNDETLQYTKTLREWRLHAAVDIAGEKNAAVKAAGDGTVKEVFEDRYYGVTVAVDHGNNIVSHYSGLAKSPPVKAGQTVQVGDVIGYLDVVPCEALDPIHLHFWITQNGKPVSPLKLMNLER